MHRNALTLSRTLFGLAFIGLAASAAQATISEPDHLLYGQVSWFGDPVIEGELTLHVPAWQSGPIARYRLGQEASLGSGYALRIPMNSVGGRIQGTAREGDEAQIYLNQELVAMVAIGGRGVARRLDLDPEMLEGLVALSVNDIEVPEGAAGTTTQAVFAVTLSQAIQEPASFSWATADGQGSDAAIGGFDCGPGVDFLDDFGTGTINPGDLETQISVTVCGNDIPDGNRHFFVQLSDPSMGVGLFKPVGQALIIDNDTVPEINIEDITVAEPPVGSTRQAVFRVSLSAEWSAAVSVDWATANGSAVAGIDYVADSNTLTFAPGQVSRQIPVTILANPNGVEQRDFFVNLSNPVQATLGKASGRAVIVDSLQTLVYVETQKNGVNVDGMSDPASLAVSSPDGAHVYVASRTADELVVFARNAETGRLDALNVVNVSDYLIAEGREIPGVNGFADLQLSADGKYVYAVAQANNAVVVFARDYDDSSTGFGFLSVVQVLFNGDQPEPTLAPPISGLLAPRSVTVSPDGNNAYIAAGGAPGHVIVFSRNAGDGKLLFRQNLQRGANDPLGNEIRGIGNAAAIVVSPDNSRVYVAGQSDDSIAVFNRNLNDNGRLSYRNRVVNALGGVAGIKAPSSLALAPGGQQLYATGRDSNTVAVFTREANGDLVFLQQLQAGVAGVEGLEEPLRIRVSPDGELAYVVAASDGTEAEPGTLTVLRRDTVTASPNFGRLSYVEIKRNNLGGVIGLWGASGVAVSPDNAHIYVAARFDQSVTVFARDLLAPVNPVLESTSHLVAEWNSSPVIDMSWAGAEDLDPSGAGIGSGISGYSIVFSNSATSEPDEIIDVTHVGDASTVFSASSAPLADAIDHWFHLRTCDNAGNCSETVRIGPYWIDATAPAGPFNLASSTHVPGDPAIPDNVISVSWAPAVDAGDAVSGLSGYSYVFNQTPTAGPNLAQNLGEAASSVDSAPLTDGLWYFHIRPIDVAGNVGQAQTIGPFAVGADVDAPSVFSVSAVAAPEGNELLEGASLTSAVTRLSLRFDKPMSASAGQLGNFRLFEGFIDSGAVNCAVADDGLISLADYSGPDRTTTLSVVSNTGLAAGDYTLVACPALEDFNGNGLDGNGDGLSGDPFSLRFSVAWDNLVPNPNFDVNLGFANWSVNEGAFISHDPSQDAGGASSSGAVRIAPSGGAPAAYAVTRCVQLDSQLLRGYAVQARALISDPIGDPDPVIATASMTFHSGSACTGILQGFISNPVTNDTAGAWLPLSASVSPGAIAGAGSVLVSLELNFPGGSAFPLQAWFDNAHFFGFGEDGLPTEPPRIDEVFSAEATEFGRLTSPLPTEASITQVIPEFSRGVFTTPGGTDPQAANNVDNYRLFSLAGAGASGPVACTDPSDVALDSVSYQAAQKRAVVRIAGNRSLPAGFYRLAVCGSIRDFDNNFLDGQGNGNPGTDYLLDFEVGTTNLLRNPNLDSTLGQWETHFDEAAGQLRWSGADRDGLLSSGSVRVLHESGPGAGYAVSQCVDLDGLTDHFVVGADILTNQAFGPQPTVTASAVFHADSDCAADPLGTLTAAGEYGHSAGVWQPLLARLAGVPAGAQSAQVTFSVAAGDGADAPFDLWLDNLKLRSGRTDVIFRNRYTPEVY